MPKQLLAKTRQALRPEPGQPARVDYKSKRQGTANLFMLFDPLAGQRYVEATDRRTSQDWAEAMQKLSNERSPEAEQIV